MNKKDYHKLLTMRASEEAMFKTLVRMFADLYDLKPRDVIKNYPINHKRAWYLLEKWSKRGEYDWGVSIDLGWLTD